MPFIFSHPAIVLPLSNSRLKFSLTGLIAGSMVPDFEFILRMKVDDNIGHRWPGLLVFNIPVALLLCYLFHNVIRNNFIRHLPMWYRHRLNSITKFNWNQHAASHKLVLALSVIVGILSHVLWDSFTQSDGAMVMRLPVLQSNIQLFSHQMPVYTMLQIASSVGGLWVVHRFIAARPVRLYKVLPVDTKRKYWIYQIVFTASILLIRVIVLPQHLTFWDVFFAGIGSFIYACVINSLLYAKMLNSSPGKK